MNLHYYRMASDKEHQSWGSEKTFKKRNFHTPNSGESERDDGEAEKKHSQS